MEHTDWWPEIHERSIKSSQFREITLRIYSDDPRLSLCSSIPGSPQIHQCGVPGPPCEPIQERAGHGHQGRLQRLHHLAHR